MRDREVRPGSKKRKIVIARRGGSRATTMAGERADNVCLSSGPGIAAANEQPGALRPQAVGTDIYARAARLFAVFMQNLCGITSPPFLTLAFIRAGDATVRSLT